MLEHGAYTLLLDACYDRERFPTIEEALEWSWARTDDEIAAVKFVLSKFFTLNDSVYAQQRVKDEIDAYRAKSIKNQEIALAREAARRSTRERIEHETCTDHHLTNNHKPITTNQEPETKNQEQEPVAAKAARVKFDPLTMKPDNVSDQVWAEWAQARSESRKPLTKAMCTAQAKQLAGHANADEVIRKSIAAGWQGLFPDSVKSTSARHSGFDQIDYMDGLTVDENGSLRF